MVQWLLLSRPLSLPRRGGSCCSLRCLSSSCSCLCCSSFCSFSRSSCCCLMARSSCCNLHRTKRHEKVQFALFSRSVLAKTTLLNNWVSVLASVLTLLFISKLTFPSLLSGIVHYWLSLKWILMSASSLLLWFHFFLFWQRSLETAQGSLPVHHPTLAAVLCCVCQLHRAEA